MERTEEQKATQAPIEVILGGQKYSIAPLVIRDAREWRKEVMALIAPLPSLVEIKNKNVTIEENPEEFTDVLTKLMVTMPDHVIDLFFQYAKDLKRDEIESIATEAEVSKAFEQVVEVAFPLAESTTMVMNRLSQ